MVRQGKFIYEAEFSNEVTQSASQRIQKYLNVNLLLKLFKTERDTEL